MIKSEILITMSWEWAGRSVLTNGKRPKKKRLGSGTVRTETSRWKVRRLVVQAVVVQKLDTAIHKINK